MSDSGQAREEAIRIVATELFYERGYHATTMRDIAAGVKIKAGTLYNYYAGKQDILMQICHQAVAELYDGVVKRLADIDDVEKSLRELIIWHVAFHAENRYAARVADDQLNALSPVNRRAVVKIRDAYEAVLRDLLVRGRTEENWTVENVPVVATGISTMCTEVDGWFREEESITPREIGDIFAPFVLRGLTGSSGEARS